MGFFEKLVIGFAVLGVAPAAHATTFTGVFSGTVASGIDATGYFVGAGFAGAALDGASVVGTFSYDDAALDGSGIGFSIRLFDLLAGYDATYSFGAFAASTTALVVEGFDSPDSLSMILERSDDVTFDGESLSLLLDGDEFLSANGIPSAFNFLNPAAIFNGVFTVARPSDGIDVSAFLSITKADSPPGTGVAVPEPASWALLVAGFGLAGGAMRLRSRRTVAFS